MRCATVDQSCADPAARDCKEDQTEPQKLKGLDREVVVVRYIISSRRHARDGNEKDWRKTRRRGCETKANATEGGWIMTMSSSWEES